MPFGEIANNPEGTTYADRAAVRAAGVHLPNQHGIAGRAAVGAESIVVSGGYEDDEDFGNAILYTVARQALTSSRQNALASHPAFVGVAGLDDASSLLDQLSGFVDPSQHDCVKLVEF